MFEITDENIPIRVYGVLDGHGESGREASVFANQ